MAMGRGWMLPLVAALLAGCGHAGSVHAVALTAASAQAAGLGSWAARWLHDDHACFTARDANGDGVLAPIELPDYPAEAFQALDADHDGQLTYAEATSASPSLATRTAVALDFARGGGEPEAAASKVGIEGLFDPIGPDKLGQNPVVMVPGYLDLELYFALLDHKVRALGRETSYVQLFPNIGDICMAAKVLQAHVERVKARTGARKIDILTHSEGGLISRFYIENLGGASSIERLVTLGTPNHGTYMGYLGPGMGATQMKPGSAFLQALNAPDEAPAGVKTTSVRAGLDEIIVPHDSPILAKAENDLVPIAEHGSIFVLPKAVAFALGGLQR